MCHSRDIPPYILRRHGVQWHKYTPAIQLDWMSRVPRAHWHMDTNLALVPRPKSKEGEKRGRSEVPSRIASEVEWDERTRFLILIAKVAARKNNLLILLLRVAHLKIWLFAHLWPWWKVEFLWLRNYSKIWDESSIRINGGNKKHSWQQSD